MDGGSVTVEATLTAMALVEATLPFSRTGDGLCNGRSFPFFEAEKSGLRTVRAFFTPLQGSPHEEGEEEESFVVSGKFRSIMFPGAFGIYHDL
ncbi:hypothetical protein SAY87_000355 [Trapa incisa]|uniref:Uncharacterized protein n=1 Tax=Trapa incisa TaxID=236973 RepID=A0AAN7GIE5_9MYRT|nr:hypothetical protein SAY87_000355 [Trapa incisa]